MHFFWLNSRVKLSNGLLFWREIGNGSNNIVFIHGTWYDSNQWLSVMEQLSLSYHCFALDLPGCSESQFSSTHYSITQMVEYLAEYIAALKLQKVYYVLLYVVYSFIFFDVPVDFGSLNTIIGSLLLLIKSAVISTD